MDTNINIVVVLGLIVLHWIGDFVLQDETWANGKSKNWNDLLTHTIVYSAFMWFSLFFVFTFHNKLQPSMDYLNCGIFALITLVCHTVTDYFSSRKVSKLFNEKKYGSKIPNFGAFTIIGIDQVLHYFQLLLTYHLLF